MLISYLSQEMDARRDMPWWVQEAGGNWSALAPGEHRRGGTPQDPDRTYDDASAACILVNNAADQATIASIEEISSRSGTARCGPTSTGCSTFEGRGGGHDSQGVPSSSRVPSSPSHRHRTPRLRDDEGRDCQLHCRSGGHAGEKGIRVNAVARADLDAAHSSTLPVERSRTRKRHAAGAGRSAGGAGRCLRASGLGRGQLHLRRRHPGDGRKADAVTRQAPLSHCQGHGRSTEADSSTALRPGQGILSSELSAPDLNSAQTNAF